MKTALLFALVGMTVSGNGLRACAVSNTPLQKSRQTQLLEQRRDLLKTATEIPSSLGLPEDLDYTEQHVYAWLTLYDAELQLAQDQQQRIRICQDRLDSLLSWEKKVRGLYDVGARGGDRWRVLRSQCRVLRGQIALVREQSAIGVSPTAADEITRLRVNWRNTAQRYAEEMRQALGDGFTNPRLILPALAEVYDAELASATSAPERVAARRRHSAALRNVESWCQQAKPKSDRWLTLLAARAQRTKIGLRLLHDQYATGSFGCAASSQIHALERKQLTASFQYLEAMQVGFKDETVWMESLLEAYRAACEAELDVCQSSAERQATLARWIGRLATMEAEMAARDGAVLSDNWGADCAAERLRLTVELDRLNTRVGMPK